MEPELRNKISDILLREKRKEYLCHVQYVVEIGSRLAKEYHVDEAIIETACLLHDIGRDKELPGEKHCQAGKRIAEELLTNSNFNGIQKEKIFSCILSHNSQEIPVTIEEQIVRTSDGGSKVQYHEAFMLLCKKNAYEERLAWGMKYLEKGYSNISLELYKKEVEQKYFEIASIYKKIARIALP
jgi:putative nucleotidyltransferase with HDIG domain